MEISMERNLKVRTKKSFITNPKRILITNTKVEN